MNLLGYSELGIMTALFYDMASQGCETGCHLFHKLISPPWTTYYTDQKPPAGKAELLIEQSFSDFGDADAVALIDDLANKPLCSIFIEAKVKTFHTSQWRIAREYDLFCNGMEQGQVSSSNLFTQLYHKVRLVQALQTGGINAVEQGVPFPPWSSMRRRGIGTNGIVLEATRRLQRRAKQAFFVMIVPDTATDVERFFRERLPRNLGAAPGWNVETYGYLTWGQVRSFCDEHGLQHTLDVFAFNDGQLY
jgi:hypothetical protein